MGWGILPLKDFFGLGEGAREYSLISHEQQAERSFVTVSIAVALVELKKKSPMAAQWFYDNLSKPLNGRYFSFGIDEVEIVDSA